MKDLYIFQLRVLMTCCTLHSVWVVSVIFKSVLHGKRQRYLPWTPPSTRNPTKCRTMPKTIETWVSPVVFVVVVVNCLSTIILLCCQHLNVIMPIILFYDSRNIFVEAHIFRALDRSCSGCGCLEAFYLLLYFSTSCAQRLCLVLGTLMSV